MEILVTGGAGFIGSNLCRALLKRGDSVYCVDNLNDYYSPKFKKRNIAEFRKNRRFHFFKMDIESRASISKLFSNQKFDVVIHLAARAGVRPSIQNPDLYVRSNIIGTSNLLEQCRKKKINNFIFASSSSVYGNCPQVPFKENMDTSQTISPYAATKKAGEVLCYTYHKVYGLNIVALRFFTAFGPNNRPDMAAYKFVNAILNGLPIEMYGDGSTSRDYTFVSDIVEGIIKAINYNKGFEIINLGSSSPITLRDFITTIEYISGRKAQIIKKPLPAGDVERTFADISKAKRLLGWEPKTELEDGLKSLIEWFQTSQKIRA